MPVVPTAVCAGPCRERGAGDLQPLGSCSTRRDPCHLPHTRRSGESPWMWGHEPLVRREHGVVAAGSREVHKEAARANSSVRGAFLCGHKKEMTPSSPAAAATPGLLSEQNGPKKAWERGGWQWEALGCCPHPARATQGSIPERSPPKGLRHPRDFSWFIYFFGRIL